MSTQDQLHRRLPPGLTIQEDDLRRPEIIALLEQHLALMYSISPPESVHALDLERLRKPDMTVWTAWRRETLLGCGALKELGPGHGEIKSMHTVAVCRGQGIGAAVLLYILQEARQRGYGRVSLETGSQPAFAPARSLYRRYGFSSCPPFGDYTDDPNSVFMTRML